MKMNKYFEQAKLMLSILPIVGQEKEFALKGGTALNFFHLNMPRISVDIDLTFLPVKPRNETLKNITDSLGRISDKVKRLFPRCQVQKLKIKDTDYTYKLIIKNQGNLVKIEPNLILRGSCYPPILKPLCKNAPVGLRSYIMWNMNELKSIQYVWCRYYPENPIPPKGS
jgi:hypothetical protein